MVTLLIVIIVVLIAGIFYLNVKFYEEKKQFKIRIEVLQKIIVEQTIKQSGTRNQIQLSQELQQSLKSSNAILSDSIFKLNYELFDLLSKNNLLKK